MNRRRRQALAVAHHRRAAMPTDPRYAVDPTTHPNCRSVALGAGTVYLNGKPIGETSDMRVTLADPPRYVRHRDAGVQHSDDGVTWRDAGEGTPDDGRPLPPADVRVEASHGQARVTVKLVVEGMNRLARQLDEAGIKMRAFVDAMPSQMHSLFPQRTKDDISRRMSGDLRRSIRPRNVSIERHLVPRELPYRMGDFERGFMPRMEARQETTIEIEGDLDTAAAAAAARQRRDLDDPYEYRRRVTGEFVAPPMTIHHREAYA